MKSDNAFYITLALIGVFGVIAVIFLRDRGKPTLHGDGLGADDEYVKKSELGSYVMRCIASRDRSILKPPMDLNLSTVLVKRLPEDALYEGKEF